MLLLIILHLYIYKYIYVICEGIYITAKYYSQLSSIILNCATKKNENVIHKYIFVLKYRIETVQSKGFYIGKVFV